MTEDRYTIYKHTSPEGKVYIGATSCHDLRNRWHYGHGYKYNKSFWADIQRFGWANFKHDILEEGLTAEEAKQREEFYINHFQSCDPDKGYNLRARSVLQYANISPEKRYQIARKISDSHYQRYLRLEAEKQAKEGREGHGNQRHRPQSAGEL